MDYFLNCSCFQKCPLSNEQGTYNAYDNEQLQRSKQRESVHAELQAQVAIAHATPEVQPTTKAVISADCGARECGDRLTSRRLERQQKFQEKYASIHEETILVNDVQLGKASDENLSNNMGKFGQNMGNIASAEDSPRGLKNDSGTAGSLPATGPVLSSFTLEGIAEVIKGNKIKESSVIVLVGAGMSTAAGVPDFRSPETGIYANLQKYNLPHPEDVFKIDYFKNNPAPFYELSRSLLPRKLFPTLSHYFVRLLHEKGYLLRCFSQNVDCLESLSGIPKEKLCLAHGSFETGHCLRCNAEYSLAWMRQVVDQGGIPHCVKTQDCKGLIKPDVKFFGERLDGRFFRLVKEDFPRCELLIIIGSSLSVMPFAQLVQRVPPRCPRLLINKTKSGHSIPAIFRIFKPSSGLMYDRKGNVRDVAHLSDCDDACRKLADLLGWRDELEELALRSRRELDEITEKGEQN